MSDRIRAAEEQLPESPPAPESPPPLPASPPSPVPDSPPPERPEQPPAREAETLPTEPPMPLELQKRWDRLTWEKYDYKRRAEEAERLIQTWQEEQRRPQLPPGQTDPKQEALEQFRAEQTMREFNAACNEVYRKGRHEFGEAMDEAKRALDAVGWGGRPDALAAIAALPDGHRVYRELASDLDNASRVLSLSPMAMAVELARMAVSGATPRDTAGQGSDGAGASTPPVPVTRAPEPLRTVGGTSRTAPVPLDKTSMADFIRRRDSEERRSRIMR